MSSELIHTEKSKIKGEVFKMKKALKRALSLVMCLAMIAGFAVITAGAEGEGSEAKFVLVDACDDLYAWKNQFESNGLASIDKTNYKQGEGCLYLDMVPDEEGATRDGPFANMMWLDLENPVNVSAGELEYFEAWTWVSRDLGQTGWQVNFCDSDLGKADGVDCNIGMDNRKAGWQRTVTKISDWPTTIPGTDRKKIDGMRFSWLSYENNMTYYEADWRIDSIIVYNQAFRDARGAEETRVRDLVTNLTDPTAENIGETEAAIKEAMTAYETAKAQYANFYIENEAKYERIAKAYMELKKADYVAEAETAINAIGEVTMENHADKLEAITAAEAKIKVLDNTFGDDYTVSNIDTLKAAREAYDNFSTAKPVIDAITALPDEITADDETAIGAARTAYDALTDGAKAVVGEELLAKLVKAEKDLYLILHPYTLGNVDMDEENKITANDALLALQASVDKADLTDVQKLAAEVDGREGISANDALLILQYSVKKIDRFPIEDTIR